MDDETIGRSGAALKLAENALRERVRPPNGIHVDPNVQQSTDGTQIVHVRHHYRGIPLFLAATRVQVDGNTVTIHNDDDYQIDAISSVPSVEARKALLAATAHLQGKLDGRPACDEIHSVIAAGNRPVFRSISSFDLPARPVVFSRGPYAKPVPVELTIIDGRLAWMVIAATRDLSEYLILVGACEPNAGAIFFCRDISSRGCTGSVFLYDPNGARVVVDFPRSLSVYPAAFHANAPTTPFSWMAADATIGNNIFDTLWDSSSLRIKARKNGTELIFDPAPLPLEREQCILNAFFTCNFMHDFFSLLGFTDADGAFHNVSGGGKGDPLELRLSSSLIKGLARMRAFKDGERPEMVLGRGSVGHSALEPAVVIHEFVHGVTQRMIGGVNNSLGTIVLRQQQALGEAWSDFFAITIQNYYRRIDGLPEEYLFASWCTGGTARTASYNGHPATFKDAGKGKYKEPQNAGEIWAAAAIDFARALTGTGDFRDLYPVAWRAMFESFRHVKAKAHLTFLDARDALFASAAAVGGSAALDIAREAFRARGMGRSAKAPDADDFSKNVEATDPF